MSQQSQVTLIIAGLLVWSLTQLLIWQSGIREGRRQMTEAYAAEVQRLNAASQPEQVKAWLNQGRQ